MHWNLLKIQLSSTHMTDHKNAIDLLATLETSLKSNLCHVFRLRFDFTLNFSFHSLVYWLKSIEKLMEWISQWEKSIQVYVEVTKMWLELYFQLESPFVESVNIENFSRTIKKRENVLRIKIKKSNFWFSVCTLQLFIYLLTSKKNSCLLHRKCLLRDFFFITKL